MNKKISTFILLLLCVAIFLCSCDEYTPAIKPTGSTETPTEELTSENEVETPEEDDSYTVSLVYNGEQYIPPSDTEIYVQWNNGFSFHKALMEDGVAKIGNLDGDYTVTLSSVPNGFSYDPNAYVATTENRHIEIKLWKVIETIGSGAELYKCINISEMGIYKVDIDLDRRGNVQEIFYEFSPRESGMYSVESWVDTVENTVNPVVNYYGANSAFKTLQSTIDDGGAESTYTKNFLLDVQINDSEFSTGGGGQVIFTFGISATSKKQEYPISVYFAVKLDGEIPEGTPKNEPIIKVPEEELVHQKGYYDTTITAGGQSFQISYDLTGAEFVQTNSTGDKQANVFDSNNYKLWKKGEGMPMQALGSPRGDDYAQKLTGDYKVVYETIIREITFTPDKDGATSGYVQITQYDTSLPKALAREMTYTGKYRYALVLGNKDTETPDKIELTHVEGDKIEYAGFCIDKNKNITFGSGDNYYHLLDKENGTYGPILYAYISSDCGFLGGEKFTTLEYRGNKALTVSTGENYKLFIEGFGPLSKAYSQEVGPYFCHMECPCRKGIKDKKGNIIKEACPGACVEGCQYCMPDCRPCPEKGINHPGYAGYVNFDGMYGVTEELRIFLQLYSTSQLLFFDGNGFVETNESRNVYAEEDDQWLFACAYYKMTVKEIS